MKKNPGKVSFSVIFLVSALANMLMVTRGMAQRLTISVENETIKNTLQILEKKAGVRFVYNPEVIEGESLVSLQMINADIKVILLNIERQSNLIFRREGNFVGITKRRRSDELPPPLEKEVIVAKGKVVSYTEGMPIVGVTVRNPSHQLVTGTDSKGNFTITGRPGDKISFQHIGYTTATLVLGLDNIHEVSLKSNVQILDKIVVTGYDRIDKWEYLGSASILNAEEMNNRPVSSFEYVLAGKVPGIVVASSGQPGDIPEVRLRGFGSMNSSNQPLYVIDGMIFDQINTSGHNNAVANPMATINPSDIANITILKDASSASLYGSQGANGVIVITTKQGVALDRLRFSFSAQGGLSSIFDAVKPQLVNGAQYKELWTEGQLHLLIQNQGGNFKENLDNLYRDKLGYFLNGLNYHQWKKTAQQDFNRYYALQKPDGTYYDYDFWGDDADKLPNTNWFDGITRTAVFQQYDLSMNGGSTNLKYFLSLGYLGQEGIILNSNLKRYSMRLNLNSDNQKKLINWGINSTISSTDQNGPLTSGNTYNMPHYAALLLPSVVPAYLEDGSYNFSFPNNLLNGNHNPIASARENIRSRPQFNLFTTGWLSINIQPWMKFRSELMQYYITGHRKEYFNKNFGTGYLVNGLLTDYNSKRIKLTSRNMVSFNHTVRNHHRFDGLASFELTDFRQQWNSVSGVNFMNDEQPNLSAATEVSDWYGGGYDYAMVSLVSKFDYSYRYRYLIGGSFRQDRSSQFAPEHRTGNFWSVSGGYKITNESWEWLHPIRRVFNNIHFKASYGYNGTVPSSYYRWRTLFDGTGRYNEQHTLFQSFRTTDDLRWEKNKILNVGVDLGILKDRIRISAEYYRRRSSDLLQDVPVSNVSGYSTILMNTSAGIVNKGFEVDIETLLLDKAIRWSVNGNMATLSSRYYGLKQDIIGTHIMRNGESVNSWFLNEFAGIDSNTGQVLFYAYNNSGKKILANADYPSSRRVLGKGIPSATGGVSNTLSYYGWTLSTLLTYGWGHDVVDGRKSLRIAVDGESMDYNIDVSQLNRWTPDNIYGTNRIRINGQLSPGASTRYLYNGDYLKLKNIKLSYAFAPATFRRLKINGLSLYGQIENIKVWTDLKGYDPDLQLDGFVMPAKYPSASTFVMGLNMNF